MLHLSLLSLLVVVVGVVALLPVLLAQGGKGAAQALWLMQITCLLHRVVLIPLLLVPVERGLLVFVVAALLLILQELMLGRLLLTPQLPPQAAENQEMLALPVLATAAEQLLTVLVMLVEKAAVMLALTRLVQVLGVAGLGVILELAGQGAQVAAKMMANFPALGQMVPAVVVAELLAVTAQ